jgi:hypothetical protein
MISFSVATALVSTTSGVAVDVKDPTLVPPRGRGGTKAAANDDKDSATATTDTARIILMLLRRRNTCLTVDKNNQPRIMRRVVLE